jgi:hypothetical protein
MDDTDWTDPNSLSPLEDSIQNWTDQNKHT